MTKQMKKQKDPRKYYTFSHYTFFTKIEFSRVFIYVLELIESKEVSEIEDIGDVN